MPYHKLLQSALFLDTESLGLQRGSGVHEIALYDLERRALHEYILKPNMVQVASAIAQENTRLATSSADTHKLVQGNRWIDIIREQLYMEGFIDSPHVTDNLVLETLKQTSPFLSKKMSSYPHLMGKSPTPLEEKNRLAMLREMGGVKTFRSTAISAEDLLKSGGPLQLLTKGKTIWGANIAFDAKQIGALVGGLEQEGIATSLKQQLQTFGPSTDPFYVTGVKVNQAKVQAQQTGDWSLVWKAYLEDQPLKGQTAVRDIQDVLRAMMTYGQRQGLTSKGDVYWGTSLDVVYRLMGSMEPGELGKKLFREAEVHRAAEDIAIHSRYVLEKALAWTHALQQVDEGTEEGKELLRMAKNNQGAYYEAATFLGRQEMMKSTLLQKSLIQRLGRAQEDLLKQGYTAQVDGIEAIDFFTQEIFDGWKVKVPVSRPHRVEFRSMDEVVNFLQKTGKYEGLDIVNEMVNMRHAVDRGENDVAKKRLLASYLEQKTDGLVENSLLSMESKIMGHYNQNLGKTISQYLNPGKMMGQAAEALKYVNPPSIVKAWGLFAGALAVGGLAWSMADGNSQPTREQPSLITYNYNQWKERQAEFYGLKDERENPGMSEQGILAQMRKQLTDFGSPYQGIMGSQMVFHNQDLLAEREKWLRQQYGAVHYDPATGLFGVGGIISRARHQGYRYIGDGESVANGYMNLRGEHLMRVNLGDGNWKINVEDADTITLKKGGLRGAVASIFGMNKGYSFRLAGVDSPEITHGERAAQPHAYKSLEGLRALLGKDKNIELVFDPTQTTYGRTMGVFFSNGKNVNYELVRRGLAAHLAYGKPSDSIIDYSVMKSMETASAGSSRGMWLHPYWKVMYDTTQKNRQRLTFNTLTQPDKIVENVWKMDMVSMMEQAQAQGMYSSAMAVEASRIGQFSKGYDADHVRPYVTGQAAAHYNSYLHYMISDTDKWMKTKGSGYNDNRFSSRGNYGDLDQALVLDSLGNTDSVWSRRKLQAFDHYRASSSDYRKHRMAATQRHVLNTMGDKDPGRYYQ